MAESFWTPTKTDELQNEPNLIDRGARAHRTTSGRVHRRERQRVVAWIKKIKGAVGEIHSTADEIFSNAKKHGKYSDRELAKANVDLVELHQIREQRLAMLRMRRHRKVTTQQGWELGVKQFAVFYWPTGIGGRGGS